MDKPPRMVAVTTLRDRGAAEVARALLEENDFPVEMKSLNPYFGTVTGVEIEVRVPADRVDEAEGVLARLGVEAEEALTHQAPDALPSEEQRAADAVREAAPPLRRKSLALGVLYSLVIPVLGPIYAGSPSVALASLFIHLPFFYGLLVGHRMPEVALLSWGLGRVIDVAGTQRALAAHNQLFEQLDDAPEPPDGARQLSDDSEVDHAPRS